MLHSIKHKASQRPVLVGAFIVGVLIYWTLFSGPQNPPQFQADNLIVGCGLSGSLLAYLHAELNGETSVIIEKRDHIAGNMYDYVDENGIRVSLYGPHFFHTNKEKVWTLLTKFSRWVMFNNRVLAEVGDKTAPVPVNIDSVNILLGKNIQNEEEMKEWLKMTQVKYPNGPQNAEEAAKARVGESLYEMLFKGYTTKQWDRDPTDLAASVTQRIPVRSNRDNRYFSDVHQAEPEYGFTGLIQGMLDHAKISYFLNTDFFEFKKTVDITQYKKIFYTGPIDAYFAAQGMEELEYRSLKFKTYTEHTKDGAEFVQPTVQLNRPHVDVPYTRSCEYKWIPWKPRPQGTKSTLIFEYPSTEGEPYYPVPNQRNRDLFSKYQRLAKEEESKRVYFVGRLANYKYFNMDDAALNVIQFYEKLYNTQLPVIDQNQIFITTTKGSKGVEVTRLEHQTPRYEERMLSLCMLGYHIRQDGQTYWIVVDNAEQPDVQIHRMIDEIGFQHYFYTAVKSDEEDGMAQISMAMKYIKDNKMDVKADVHPMEHINSYKSGMVDAVRQGKPIKNYTIGPWTEDKGEARSFCVSLLKKMKVPVPASV